MKYGWYNDYYHTKLTQDLFKFWTRLFVFHQKSMNPPMDEIVG